MKLFLLLGYLLFSKEKNVEEVIIRANEEELALPAAGVAGLKVGISIDALGKVEAQAGAEKLAKFAPNEKAGMKPLDDWMAKLGKEDPLNVSIQVHGEARQQVVIDLLNLLTQKGITQITFTDHFDPKK